MIDSRCGLHCTGCSWKTSHGCGGCIETMGKPFHGECPIAVCCQEKNLAHCGECDIIPCDKLYAYSYLDPEHGDKPPGERVRVCRKWAAESGKQAWCNVLLTSAGWINDNIRRCFLEMLSMDAKDAKVLFIPTAAVSEEALRMVDECKKSLLYAGILPENIFTYDIGDSLSEDEAMRYDAIYFTGGDTKHLISKINETGFDAIIKKMVYANKVYVGVSAGSIIAAPNIGGQYDKETSGLALVNAFISVHCEDGRQPRTDLPLPHIPLTDMQALAVAWNGYKIIE